MTAIQTPVLRLNDPAELIEAIPYLIGFRPSESLVLLGFVPVDDTGRKQVAVSVRIDLPPPAIVPGDLLPLVQSMNRSRVTSVVAIVITEGPGDLPRHDPRWVQLTAVLADAFSSGDIALDDTLVASSQRWWSVQCDTEACCPSDGHARSGDASIAVAEATYHGLVALPDRDSVAIVLAPLSDAERHRWDVQLARAEEKALLDVAAGRQSRRQRTEIRALMTEVDRRSEAAGAARRLTPTKLARFGVALTDITVRDALWMRIDDGSVVADSLLLELLRRLPEPYDAAPLFLFGWGCWRRGNGTLATMAADRALAARPGYSAAQLLLEVTQRGIDPRTMPSLREPVDESW